MKVVDDCVSELKDKPSESATGQELIIRNVFSV